MNLIANLVPEPGALSDKAADARITALGTALSSGDYSVLDENLRPYAERIGQATRKTGSGAEIARISELMTLAQFGAASVGAAVARACNDAKAEPLAEALLVARFLVEVVFEAPRSPALLPGDVLRDHQLHRESLSWPQARPVYRQLLARASDTIDRADALGIQASAPALREMLARHRMETVRQIARLHDRDPESAGARLTGFDRLVISLRLFLRLRGPS